MPDDDAGAVAYRGPDRRSVACPASTVRPLQLAADAAQVLLVAGIGSFLCGLVVLGAPAAVPALTMLLLGGACAACVVAAEQAWVRWRLVGDALSARVAAATMVLGLTVAPLAAHPSDGHPGAVGQVIGMVASATLLLAACRAPQVVARCRTGACVAVAAGVTVGAVVGAAVLPAPAGLTGAARTALAALGVAGAVLTAGIATAVGLRRDRGVLARCGVATALLAVQPAAVVAVGTRGGAVTLVSAAVVAAAVALVVRATAADAQLAIAATGRYAVGLRERWWHAVATADGIDRERREHDHEIRSALLAIDAVGGVLAQRRAQQEADEEAELVTALQHETARLRRLVAPRSRGATVHAYRALDVLGSLCAAHRATGRRIDLAVPRGLVVHGRPDVLAEVVNELLVNAAVHAPRAAVTVEGGPVTDGRARLVVRDTGPGFSPGASRSALEYGWSRLGEGHGTGLPVAARLLREDGGSLALAPPCTGAGAAVVLELPLPPDVGDDRLVAAS